MVVYPDEDQLIARGKYSTLNGERKQQIERVAKLANTMQQHLLLALNGIQEKPPTKREHLDSLRACLGNWENSWNRIEELYDEMTVLKPMAWDGKTDE